MAATSAGILMFKGTSSSMKFFLVHPGGPFFKNKDLGSWTIPKGLQEENEELLQTAIREFKEETGIEPIPPFIELGFIKQKGGKVVYGWAFETKDEIPDVKSNTFSMEWPPKSGRKQEFPEIDKAQLFEESEAVIKINQAQIPFIERLVKMFKE